jgi:quinol monooxygenase YgiN
MSITVIASFTAKAESVADLKRELAVLIRETRQEAGCLSYRLFQSPENACQFRMIEQWADEAALAAHFNMPHTKAVFAVAPELLASKVEITRWSEVPDAD